MKKMFYLKKLCAALMLLCFGCGTSFASVATSPCTSDATEAAKKLYSFLLSNYGTKTISGAMTGDNSSATTLADQPDLSYLYQNDGGKYPAMVGFDFLMTTGKSQNDGWFSTFSNNVITMAKETWKKGGIPSFCWHWRDPSHTVEDYSDTIVSKGYWDFTKAFTETGGTEWNTSSDEYNYMITDIDRVADQLLKLQKSGVAVIWRPLHEAAGRWFWWSATCTSDQYIALWKLVYNEMVNVKGVKNCIWVWTIERSKERCQQTNDWSSPATLVSSWYPGDEYVDIIGVDVYKRGSNTSVSDFYNKIVEEMGDNKMITLSETDYIPDITNMQNDGAMWSWWMPWDQSWSSMYQMTSSDVWKTNMASEYVITLDEMEDWGTYVEEEVVDPCDAQTDLRKEAECADYSGVVVVNDAMSGGKGISIQEDAGYINFTFNVPSAGTYKVIVGDLGIYGGKQYNVVVGSASGTITTEESSETVEYYGGSYRMSAGEVTVGIKPAWTWFVVDYVRLELDTEADAPVTPSASLVTPNSTESAQKLYNFLVTNWGKKTISGFMTGSMDGATTSSEITDHEDVQAVYTRSGKYPALVGFDFMNATGKSVNENNSWYINYTNVAIALAKKLWKKGGIPAFTWHWRSPSYETDGFYVTTQSDANNQTDFNFTEAMNADGSWNTTSTYYKNMIADIDKVADYFLDLQEEGVAAIFRPLHEASGAWFWWGTQGGANYAKLYQLVYNEMVNVKGVKNLVWVWNPEYATDSDWNPGAGYYDVVSIDIYNNAKDYQSNYVAFNNLKKLTSNSKLVALSENGPVPDVDDCYDNDATWSWWMPWYQSWSGNFADQTETTQWKKVMEDERIITLEDMVAWSEYVISDVVETSATTSVSVYPTLIENGFTVKTEKEATVDVYSVDGQSIFKKTVAAGETYVDMSQCKYGVYVVVVGYDNLPYITKLVKKF